MDTLPFQYTTERMKCMNVIFCMSVIRDDDGEIRIGTSGAVSQEKMAPFLISIISGMMDDEAKSAQKMRAILADCCRDKRLAETVAVALGDLISCYANEREEESPCRAVN